MVALQILVLPAQVRVLVPQRKDLALAKFFCLYLYNIFGICYIFSIFAVDQLYLTYANDNQSSDGIQAGYRFAE